MCWPRAVGNPKQNAFNAAFLSTTIGAILTVFFAPLASLPEPFTPIQILWVAIIMDGPPAV